MTWSQDLRQALVALGEEDDAVQRIVEETLDHARESGGEPGQLFGPAHAYARHVVDQLRCPPPEPVGERPPGTPLLALRGVTKRYRRRVALPPIDLTVRAGEVAAVVGANGSGKSTLLKVCAGLLRPDGGQVFRTGRVGYVPQQDGTVDLLTAAEHFALFGAAAGMPRRLACSTGAHLAKRLSWRVDADQPAGRLSGGTRQKLNLVLGGLHGADVLLLDEPYQGFDHGSYLDFWQQVWSWRDAGRAVVVVTHLLHELDRADHVVDLGAAAGRVPS